MIRVVATSDLHGHLPDASTMTPCDLLLIAGDVCPIEDHAVKRQKRWLESSFADWLETVPARSIAWIAGNHDFALAKGRPPKRVQRLAHYLQDEAVEIHGLRVYGTPWSVELGAFAFTLEEKGRGPRLGLEDAFAMIPEDADVILTHNPPFGYGDICMDGSSGGSPSLLRRLEAIRPQLAVFGHIHRGSGEWELGETILANVSHVSEEYLPKNPPRSFLLPDP
jgi:Icc-related predicted phosphoesterase